MTYRRSRMPVANDTLIDETRKLVDIAVALHECVQLLSLADIPYRDYHAVETIIEQRLQTLYDLPDQPMRALMMDMLYVDVQRIYHWLMSRAKTTRIPVYQPTHDALFASMTTEPDLPAFQKGKT